jgi:hypothetical protein
MKLSDHKPFQVESIGSMVPGAPDSLFICCASFEERAVGAARRLATGFRCERSIIFIYDSPDYRADRLRHFEELRRLLLKTSLQGLDVIGCERGNVFDGMSQLREILQQTEASRRVLSVTIDITTFTKLYLLELLYALTEEWGVKNIRILYSLPRVYGSGKLSEGVADTVVVPHLAGFLPVDGDVVLMAFLGFEGERALAVVERYDPRLTIALVSEPEYRSGYKDRVERENAFLLSRPGVVQHVVSPYEPIQTFNQMQDAYYAHAIRPNCREPYMVLLPLGTHMQAVSTFLFWRRFRNAHVVYVFPTRYGPGYAKRGVAETLSVDLSSVLREPTGVRQ